MYRSHKVTLSQLQDLHVQIIKVCNDHVPVTIL